MAIDRSNPKKRGQDEWHKALAKHLRQGMTMKQAQRATRKERTGHPNKIRRW